MEKKYVIVENRWGVYSIIFDWGIYHDSISEGCPGFVVLSGGEFTMSYIDGKIRVKCYETDQSKECGLKVGKDDVYHLENTLNSFSYGGNLQ